MPVQVDAAFAAAVKNHYGEYTGTLRSENSEVRADMFKQGEWLVAHVSFPTGLDLSSVSDKYLAELNSYAAQKGFSGKLRMVFS